MYKIAVLGDRDSIYGFSALGLDIYPTEAKEDAARLLKKLADNEYAVIYITEAMAQELEEEMDEYRIRQSMQLLKETDLSVMEICMDCGFNNLGNFLRQFRKYTGTTPLKYKKSE